MEVVEQELDSVESVACSLCGSRDDKIIFSSLDKTFSQNRQCYPVVRCNRCGLVYLNPRPAPAAKAEFYSLGYAFTADRPENSQPLHHYQPVIDRLKKMKPGRLLDVGTGNSPFLPEMRRLGWDVYGTEVDGGLVDYFRENHQIELFHGELAGAGYAEASFDAVTILGVLEHVPDPLQIIQEAARILKDDGILALWCFNRGLEARILGRYWLGFDSPRHLYSFSFPTLTKLTRRAGLEVESSLFRPICYLSYSGLWAVSRLRNRFRPPERQRPIYWLRLPRPLEIASRPLGKWMARRQLSSNVYLFAKKMAAAIK